jgi:antibiotic biosynthesis monooxygenase
MIAIAAFVVPPDADERFLGSWSGAGTLHRALRADAEFRFVAIGGGEAAAAFPAWAGRYAVRHEDGAPDGREGVLVVHLFEVPAPEAERFVAGWNRVRELLAAERGYLGTRLHEAVDDAAIRFVNVARWSSPLMVSRALGRPEVREAAGALPYRSHAALYQVVDVP